MDDQNFVQELNQNSQSRANIEPAVTPEKFGVMPPVAPPKKAKIDLTVKDRVFAILIFVFSIFWVDFALFGKFSLGFAIATVVFFVLSLVYLINKGKKVKAYPIFCGILAIASTPIFFLHTSGFDAFGTFVLIMVLFAFYLTQISESNYFLPGTFRTIGDVALNYFLTPFANIPVSLRSLFSKNENKTGNKTKGVLIGILCAVPVIAIVIPLLFASNPFFEKIFSSIFDEFGIFLVKIFLGSLIFVPIFAALFAYNKGLAKPQEKIEKTSNGLVEPLILNSFLSVISVVYVLYLLTQIAYFFSAFKGILPAGYDFTLAEYARKGFFELCVVAAINILLIFLCILLIKKKENGNTPKLTKALATFVCLFTILLIATAISKMVLYIDNFGMTRLRIQTSCFMIFLALVFVYAIIRIFKKNFPYFKFTVSTLCIIVVAVNIFGVNSTIAKYNYNAYKNGKLKTIDVDTLYDLGDASVPYLIKLLDEKDVEIHNQAHNALIDIIFDDYEVKCTVHGSNDEYCERQDRFFYYRRVENQDLTLAEEGTTCTGTARAEIDVDFDIKTFNKEKLTAAKLLNENQDKLLANYFED